MPGDPSAPELAARLRERAYLADAGLATVLSVSLSLRKPLLLEGESGVGKTEAAKALADVLGDPPDPAAVLRGDRRFARAVRLELCAPDALHPDARGRRRGDARAPSTTLFGADFIVRRPLLDAIDSDEPMPPVLLIDEIDRADDEFEAFLLELLSDFQVTIPEIGTIHARAAPGRDPHLEPHPRAARRASAPLPLPLDRLSVGRARDRDRPAAGCRAFR